MNSIAFEARRVVDAPPDVVWKVVSDLVGFADVAPSLTRIEIVAGEGQGTRRRCHDTRGRSWEEVCTVWDEGRTYTMRVDTATYPFPLRHLLRGLQGTWTVDPVDGGTRITMRFEAEPGLGIVGRFLVAGMAPRFRRESEQILDAWEERIVGLPAGGSGGD